MTSTLREQVAQAVLDVMGGPHIVRGRDINPALADEYADAAIGVVLGVVADEIKALDWTAGVHTAAAAGFGAACEEMLAVVERLRGEVSDGE